MPIPFRRQRTTRALARLAKSSLAQSTMLGVLMLAPAGLALAGPITIGQGPFIGQDSGFPSNVFYEEFQDWTPADLRALDTVPGGTYEFGDGFNNSRDLVAFYNRFENNNLYMRVDLYDLATGAENNNMDLYVAIDCAPGGASWLPDFTDVQVDPSHNWEICVALYNSTARNVYNSSYSGLPADRFIGSYYNATLDAIEFGITRQTLIDAGWNGSSTVYFTVATVRDGSLNGPGEINGGFGSTSDVTDTFFDNGRGFDDGFINGAIASNATTGRAKYASIAHGNQSVNKANDTRVHVFDPTNAQKTGFIRALDTHEIFNVPLNIHPSGSLLVASQWALANPLGDPATIETPMSDGPAFIRRMREFVDADQTRTPGALVGGVLAEHIMPYFEGPINQKSIDQFDELIDHHFGLSAAEIEVMHTPERVIRAMSGNPNSYINGNTFTDIANSDYKATVLDEVTHYHWWFDAANTTWSGHMGNGEAPAQHKIQRIHGVYCFLINDREDQRKFGNDDGGAMLDTRYTLIEKAVHADQAQLTLVFDDWEAMAGKSFDPLAGVSTPNNNQVQYQNTVRWLANKQWIEIVTLQEILHRATQPGHPQYNAAWVIDRGNPTNLGMQTYEWLKNASKLSYNFWYYDNDGFGSSGLEQNFSNLVPVITGEQGDYIRRFPFSRPANDAAANALDGPKLPSGKRFGDIHTPGTLVRDSWDDIQAAPNNNARRLAEWMYTNMIYETAWHEEDDGNYSTHNYQTAGFPSDSDYDGLNTWALRLHNHLRKTTTLGRAALWADQVRLGTQGATTVKETADVDQDGENEYILKNNKVWAVFERYGARCTYAFVWDPVTQQPINVIGAAVANPSEPGEEERVGTAANKCSAFKEMNTVNGQALADAVYNVVTSPADGFAFQWTNGGRTVTKTITLPTGSPTMTAAYNTSNVGQTLYTRVGLSVNNLDLHKSGRENLVSTQAGNQRHLYNTQGGSVLMTANGSAAWNNTPADAGFQNRNLALTEQFEFSGPDNASYSVTLEITPDANLTETADQDLLATAPSSWSNELLRDSDGDGLSDGRERFLGTNPRNPDTDGDGTLDGIEADNGWNPLSSASPGGVDSDGDGISDARESLSLVEGGYATNPADPDTDDDGFTDGYEIAHYSSPRNAAITPPLGDVNNDGVRNATDVALIRDFSVKNLATLANHDAADIDGNGVITVGDLTRLQNFVNTTTTILR